MEGSSATKIAVSKSRKQNLLGCLKYSMYAFVVNNNEKWKKPQQKAAYKTKCGEKVEFRSTKRQSHPVVAVRVFYRGI